MNAWTLFGFICGAAVTLCASVRGETLVEMQGKYSAHDAKARRFLTLVLEDNWDGATALIDAGEVPRLEVANGLKNAAKIFNGGTLIGVSLVGVGTAAHKDSPRIVARVKLNYELQLSTGWFLGTITVATDSNELPVKGMQFNQMGESMAAANRFDALGHGIGGICYLLAMLLILAAIVTAATVCIRSSVRKKWAWLLFIVVGLAKLEFNWGSGAFKFFLLHLQVLGIAVRQDDAYAPWLLGLSLPVGAVLFLILFLRGRLDVVVDAGEPAS